MSERVHTLYRVYTDGKCGRATDGKCRKPIEMSDNV